MIVSVEVFVATMENASAHQGALRPPGNSRWRLLAAPEPHAQRGDAEQVGNDDRQSSGWMRIECLFRSAVCTLGKVRRG